jgi:hypothetical protein
MLRTRFSPFLCERRTTVKGGNNCIFGPCTTNFYRQEFLGTKKRKGGEREERNEYRKEKNSKKRKKLIVNVGLYSRRRKSSFWTIV